MNFDKLQTNLAQILNIDEAETTDSANLKRWINLSYKNINGRYRWSWLKRKASLNTTITYKTGTATVVNGSRSVTGSGTAWTSAMIGSYFRIVSSNQWYKIIAVGSGTTLTLEMTYTYKSVTDGNYEIWKRYYEVNTDVKDIENMYADGWGSRVLRYPSREGMEVTFNLLSSGTPPRFFIEVNPTKAVTTYSTGTVAGTINTRTLTGTNTLWLDNVKPGDLVTILTATYNVYTVDSDTQLTLCQNLDVAPTTPFAYSITRKENKRIQFDKAPSDYGDVITYDYIKNVYDMNNDLDEPEMPETFHELILLGAIPVAYKSLDDTREGLATQIYEQKVLQAYKSDTNDGDQPDSWTVQCQDGF